MRRRHKLPTHLYSWQVESELAQGSNGVVYQLRCQRCDAAKTASARSLKNRTVRPCKCTTEAYLSRRFHNLRSTSQTRGIRFTFETPVQLHRSIGERPSPEAKIARINKDRGFEPGNLRWEIKEPSHV